jgi:sterol desaturase/sphingolipid hydroxylase (fatty acid hydroxylase superfamily)
VNQHDINHLSLETKRKAFIFILRNALILVTIILASGSYWALESTFWGTYLLFIFIISLIEYTLHRFGLHSQKRSLTPINKIHMTHHGLSQSHCYYFSDKNHAATILLAPLTILYIFIGVALPGSYLVSLLLGDPLYFFVSLSSFASYLALYETIHFLYHLENLKSIFPFKVTENLLDRHISHHKNVNSTVHFGVVGVFWDDIFRTTESKK